MNLPRFAYSFVFRSWYWNKDRFCICCCFTHRADRSESGVKVIEGSHAFLLARIAVRASFATRRIRVLLDVLAMFSSAFAAAMILSLSSDTGGVGAVASMAQYAESMRRKSCSLNAFSPAKTIVDVGTSGTSFHPGTLAGLARPASYTARAKPSHFPQSVCSSDSGSDGKCF